MNQKLFKTILFFLLVFLFYFLISVPYYSGDIKNHLVWAQSILSHGTMGFYQREFHNFAFPNYPPIAMFSFAFSLFFYQVILGLVHSLNNSISIFPSNLVHYFESENVQIAFLKLPELLATFVVSLYFGKMMALVKKPKNFKIYSLFLFNPAVIYLTAIWGQIDLLPLAFFLPAIYYLYKKNIYISFFLAMLALLSKQTVLVYWVVFVILAFKMKGVKSGIIGLAISLITFYLSYLPFHTFSFLWPIQLYQLNFSLVAYSVGENAINLWGLLFNFSSASDTAKLGFLTLQQWGYLLFGIFYVNLIFFIFVKKIDLSKLMEMFFVITLCYFFFLTRMHERYLIPAVVFSSFLVFVHKKYVFALLFFSFLHFFNLYRGLYMPNIPFFTAIVHSVLFLQLLVCIYGLSIMYYFLTFFKKS